MNYQKIYDQIIKRAKDQIEERLSKKKIDTYFEGHHIIPKCLGGTGRSKQYFHDNIVLLTAREHFLCHWLLHEIHPDNSKLSIAFWSMCYNTNKNHSRDYIPSSRIVEMAKQSMIEGIKNRKSGRLGKAPWNKGKKLDDPKYSKGGLSNIGRTHSSEVNKKKGRAGNTNGCKKIKYISLSLEFNSITDAAKYLKISRPRIYKLIKDNQIIYV
jgi:hypothetical protein